MRTYKTPGVYVEEIPTLPASISAVPTAIPAFIGYTEKQPNPNEPILIASLEEFEAVFGAGYEISSYTVTTAPSTHDFTSAVPDKRFYLYDSLKLFFDNRGGSCYIVSVGTYAKNITSYNLEGGLTILEQWDEPTLLLFPDAVGLKDSSNDPAFSEIGSLQQKALIQCNKLKDRFAILDVMEGAQEKVTVGIETKTTTAWFRQNIGINFLDYGAVYHPWVSSLESSEVKLYQLSYPEEAIDPSLTTKLSNAETDIVSSLNIVSSPIWRKLTKEDPPGNTDKEQSFPSLYSDYYVPELLKPLKDIDISNPGFPTGYDTNLDLILGVFREILEGMIIFKRGVTAGSELNTQLDDVIGATKGTFNLLIQFEKKVKGANPDIIIIETLDSVDTLYNFFVNGTEEKKWLGSVVSDIHKETGTGTDYGAKGGAISNAQRTNLLAKLEQLSTNIIQAAISMFDAALAVKQGIETEIESLKLSKVTKTTFATTAKNWQTEVETLLGLILNVVDSSGAWTDAELKPLVGTKTTKTPSDLFLRRKNFQQLFSIFYQNLVKKVIEASTPANSEIANLLTFLDLAQQVFEAFEINSLQPETLDLLQGINSESSLKKAVESLADLSIIDRTDTPMNVLAALDRNQIPQTIFSFLSDLLKNTIDFETKAEAILFAEDSFFSKVYDYIIRHMRLLPPSGAIAGIYAQVDANRGVFKAPANVSITSISGPAFLIDDEDQADLNVHPSGKSVNAIRSFVNKGTLVWGARTLDGNSNEWRYVPVRRFFIFVEESIQKALEPFVFEPNDRNTWIRVRGMISNFLIGQWRAGALFGAKQEDAFFVRIGLGETMTAEDVLDGKMILEIGLAAVRPAEFIILKFMHKLAVS